MKSLLLFVVGACALNCFNEPVSNCIAVGCNCTVIPGICLRSNSAPPCDITSASTCPGTDCANSTALRDGQTCSTCGDTCIDYQSNDTCVASGVCTWTKPFCTYEGSGGPPVFPCSSSNQTGCVAEAGCFWFDVSNTQCGASTTNRFCTQCNGTFAPYLSALHNNVGNTCSWSVVAPFTLPFSLTVNSYAQDSTLCTAVTAPTTLADQAALTAAAYAGLFVYHRPFDNSSTITCVPVVAPTAAPTTKAPQAQAASANSLFPSLAVMAVFFVTN